MLGLLLLVGCKPRRDCEAYAQKFTDTIEPAPERVASILESSRRSCESGRVPDAELACVARAEDANDIRRCQGLAPLTEAAAPGAATPAPSAAPPQAPPGSTRVTLVGTKRGTMLLVPSEMTAAQAEWYAGLEKEVAACETTTVHAPGTREVVVFFSQGVPTVDVAGFPLELGSCLTLAFGGRQPASVPMGSMMFTVAMGQ